MALTKQVYNAPDAREFWLDVAEWAFIADLLTELERRLDALLRP